MRDDAHEDVTKVIVGCWLAMVLWVDTDFSPDKTGIYVTRNFVQTMMPNSRNSR